MAVAQATINQDMDLIKSCSEVKRVAACRYVALLVCNKDRETNFGLISSLYRYKSIFRILFFQDNLYVNGTCSV